LTYHQLLVEAAKL